MPLVRVDLQDGFSDDQVEVRAGGVVLVSEAAVRTMTQISLAKLGEPKEFPAGLLQLDVEVPTRDLRASRRIDLTADTYIGISIESGTISFRLSPEPLGYL